MHYFRLCCFLCFFVSTSSYAQTDLKVSLLYSNGAQRAAYSNLLQRFAQHNQDIKLVIKSYEAEKYKAEFAHWLQEPTHSDVMYWFSGERLRSFVKQGLIKKLDKQWQDNHWQQQFSSGAISSITYHGHQYALPIHYYPWAIYYKKSLFERLNISPAHDWQSFLENCATLKKNGIAPIVIGSKNYWTLAAWFDYLNLRINGLQFHQALVSGKISYLDVRVRSVFNYWQVLINQGYFLTDHHKLSWRKALPFLYREKGGMMLMGNFWTSQIPAALYHDFEMFRFPIINSSLPVYEEAPTDVWLIPANVQNLSAAQRFLQFMASRDIQYEINTKLGMIAPNPSSALSEDHFIEHSYQILGSAAGVSQFYDRDNPPPIASEGLKEFARFVANPLQLEDVLNKLEQLRIKSFKLSK